MALAMTGILAVTGSALAAGTTDLDKSVTTGTTTVSLNVDSSADSYTFTIPAAVTIDPATQRGEGVVTLKAGWELVSVNGISIAISKAANGVVNCYSNTAIFNSQNFQNFKLINDAGSIATYGIKASTHRYPMADQSLSGSFYSTAYTDSLIEVRKGGDNTVDKTSTLEFYVHVMPEAGVYTDTLTFAITTN